jgi:hypothetical protein
MRFTAFAAFRPVDSFRERSGKWRKNWCFYTEQADAMSLTDKTPGIASLSEFGLFC